MTGRSAGLDAAVLSLLAEAIFAYIDELSADSVEGYAEAQADLEDQRRRRSAELAALLVREPHTEQADVRSAAQVVGWALPDRVAALALPEAPLGVVARRLPVDPNPLGLQLAGRRIQLGLDHVGDLGWKGPPGLGFDRSCHTGNRF